MVIFHLWCLPAEKNIVFLICVSREILAKISHPADIIGVAKTKHALVQVNDQVFPADPQQSAQFICHQQGLSLAVNYLINCHASRQLLIVFSLLLREFDYFHGLSLLFFRHPANWILCAYIHYKIRIFFLKVLKAHFQ